MAPKSMGTKREGSQVLGMSIKLFLAIAFGVRAIARQECARKVEITEHILVDKHPKCLLTQSQPVADNFDRNLCLSGHIEAALW